MKPGNTGFTRIIKASGYSIKGIKATFKHEAAFRQEVAASLILVPLALYLGDSGVERALLLGSWLLVPLVELINSSIEAVVDRIGPEHHKLSGRAKDIGSASVALTIMIAAIMWALILVPKYLT
ncbi:diacylglycerol kinase [Solemya velum gill symbiont]|uniref:diacylglycerol kinase n=1 Tax=Solemya velum gill symbiont TaxID=2340 RepID=UPI000996B385|nr:diacylglycerol kinase [Solemya velum gill symbiont]OOY64500.1 diacylglycerol kinase [Solemya velum gill symbiont]